MKAKPQIHFWVETVGGLEHGKPGDKGYRGTTVYALNACRGWDVLANGVFMIFTHEELWRWSAEWSRYFMRPGPRDLVVKKLEAREAALENYYGREEVKHHRDQIDLTPAERRESQHRRRRAEDQGGGDHVVSARPRA